MRRAHEQAQALGADYTTASPSGTDHGINHARTTLPGALRTTLHRLAAGGESPAGGRLAILLAQVGEGRVERALPLSFLVLLLLH